MKTSEVFRLARELMECKEGSRFICNTLLHCLGGVRLRDIYRTRRVIMVRIHPFLSLDQWAEAHNLPNVDNATEEDFHAFRIRWLIELEREFRGKRD